MDPRDPAPFLSAKYNRAIGRREVPQKDQARPRIFVALVVACLAAGVGMVVTGRL